MAHGKLLYEYSVRYGQIQLGHHPHLSAIFPELAMIFLGNARISFGTLPFVTDFWKWARFKHPVPQPSTWPLTNFSKMDRLQEVAQQTSLTTLLSLHLVCFVLSSIFWRACDQCTKASRSGARSLGWLCMASTMPSTWTKTFNQLWPMRGASFWQFLALLGSIASNPSYNIAIFFFGIWAYNNRDSNAPIKTVSVCGIYTQTVAKSDYLSLTSSLLHWPSASLLILCGLVCTAITLLTREALDLPWREWPNFDLC